MRMCCKECKNCAYSSTFKVEIFGEEKNAKNAISLLIYNQSVTKLI